MGEFADDPKGEAPERAEKMFAALNESRMGVAAAAAEEPGFFGASQSSLDAQARMGESVWSKFDRIKQGFDSLTERELMARDKYSLDNEAYVNADAELQRVPIALQQSFEDLRDLKGELETSTAQHRLLERTIKYEEPIYDTLSGELLNPDRVDPATPADVHDQPTIKQLQAKQKEQAKQQLFAQQIQKFEQKRNSIRQDRRYRDLHEVFTSIEGYRNGYPIGMSREEEDILDVVAAKRNGLTEFEGKPIDQAFLELGGEKKLQVAKLMEALFTAEQTQLQAQMDLASGLSGDNAEELRDAAEAAHLAYEKIKQEVVSAGYTEEVLKRQQTTHGWTS